MAHHLCIYCNKENPEVSVDDTWFHIDCYQKNPPITYPEPQNEIETYGEQVWLKILLSLAQNPMYKPAWDRINTIIKDADEIHKAYKERWGQ